MRDNKRRNIVKRGNGEKLKGGGQGYRCTHRRWRIGEKDK
jgi:hypothetical protein